MSTRTELDAALAKVLSRRNPFTYTEPASQFFDIECDGDRVIVVGDGDNGMYEWLIWDAKAGLILSHSDAGYGAPEWALRDGLIACSGVSESIVTVKQG